MCFPVTIEDSVSSTPLSLDDTARQTEVRNSDGVLIFLDPDNKEVLDTDRDDDVKYTHKMEDVLDPDGNKIITPGVKTKLKDK